MAQIHVQFVRSNIARNNDQSFFLYGAQNETYIED